MYPCGRKCLRNVHDLSPFYLSCLQCYITTLYRICLLALYTKISLFFIFFMICKILCIECFVNPIFEYPFWNLKEKDFSYIQISQFLSNKKDGAFLPRHRCCSEHPLLCIAATPQGNLSLHYVVCTTHTPFYDIGVVKRRSLHRAGRLWLLANHILVFGRL